MTSEINQLFYRYAASLEIPHYPHGLVNKRAEQVEQKLIRAGWSVLGHQIIGSYTRGTAIRPMESNNVDVLIELDETAYREWKNPEATRHVMRTFETQLSRLYREPIHSNGREIRISFPEFRLDVVPAMPWHGGRYLIPDAYQERWLYADPDGFRERVHNADKQSNGLLVPLIKLAKEWNRVNGNLLEGIHIESMIMRRYDGTCRLGSIVKTLPIAVCDFFLALPSMLEAHISDPVHNQRVDLYLQGSKSTMLNQAAQDIAMTAASQAGAAYERLLANQPEAAMQHFGALFHQEFLVPQR